MDEESKQAEQKPDAGSSRSEEEEMMFSTVSAQKEAPDNMRRQITSSEGLAAEKANPRAVPIDAALFRSDEDYKVYLVTMLQHREEKGRVQGKRDARPSYKELLFQVFSACITVLWVWQTLVWTGSSGGIPTDEMRCLLQRGPGAPEPSALGAGTYEAYPWLKESLFAVSNPLPIVIGAYPPVGGCVRVNGPFNSTGDNEIVNSLIHHAQEQGFGAFSAPRLDRPYCALVTGFTLMLNPEIAMVNTGRILEAEESAPLTCPEDRAYKLTRSSHVMVRYQNADHEWLLLEVKDLVTAWAMQSEITYLNRGLSPCNGDTGLPTTVETLRSKF